MATVHEDWLKKDSNNFYISQWASKRSDSELFCSVCAKIIRITRGFFSVQQHIDGEKHKKNCRAKINSQNIQTVSDTEKDNSSLKLISNADAVVRAELVWALKVVASNFSAESVNGIAEVFRKMFLVEGAVPEKFSLSSTKISYLITDALAPYFRNEMLEEARASYYSLQYDETTNNAGRKELQIRVRFWSSKVDEVVSCHLESFYMGHATAEDVKNTILKAINNAHLPLAKLISITSDGPNVNKKALRLLNEDILSVRGKNLMDMGSCTIHTVHNSFLKGLKELGEDASDLIIAIYHFFDGWPSRCEDYNIIQKKKEIPQHKFLKHVNSRWLTLGPAIERILEQWEAINEYFLKFIPLKTSHQMKSSGYDRICALLKKKTMKCELLFLLSSISIFTKYTKMFQKEEPLIHKVYSELKDLVISIAIKICKQDVVKIFQSSMPSQCNPFEKNNLIPLTDLIFEKDLQSELSTVPEKDKLLFFCNVQNHYLAAGCYLLKADNMSNKNIKYLRCLNPSGRKHASTVKDLIKLLQALPLDLKLDCVVDELKLVQIEEEPEEKISRVDKYWKYYFEKRNHTDELKYPLLSILFKAALTIHHGSADVERGFSLSNQVMGELRTNMKERMLNSRLIISDALKLYDNKPELVPITKNMIAMARTAYKNYNMYLEEEKNKKKEREDKDNALKKLKEEEKLKREAANKSKEEVNKLEIELKKVKEDAKLQATVSDKLITEASERLRNALKSGDMAEAKLAQSMIEGFLSSKKELEDKEKEVDKLRSKIGKRQKSLITSFFAKKPRQE